MLTIFYSPHATSVDNEARRSSGHADVPLSAIGKQRAQELGENYGGEAIDAIFCSDLRRAAMTGEIAFSARKLPLILDARLREYDYGDMTQYPLAQVEPEFPLRVRNPFPHGESMEMVVCRMGEFLRDMVDRYDKRIIVVIGHRATRYGLEYWCGRASLEEIVNTPWEWREVPIWRYTIDAGQIESRSSQT